MKALSIRQPYAGLIVAGIKNIENRSWAPKQPVGRLAICSSQAPDVNRWWETMRTKCKRLHVPFPEDLCMVNGAVLGVVDFNYFVCKTADGLLGTDHPTIEVEQVTEWWNPDSFGFILEHPRVLEEPIPIRGQLDLFDLPEDVVEEIERQLRL